VGPADAPVVGPSRIRWELEREGRQPLPGRSSVYRALVRHGLADADGTVTFAGTTYRAGANRD
jgi:hypothetical protein